MINYRKLYNADGETIEFIEAEAWTRFAAAAAQTIADFSQTPWVNAVVVADEMMVEFRKRFVPDNYVPGLEAKQ